MKNRANRTLLVVFLLSLAAYVLLLLTYLEIIDFTVPAALYTPLAWLVLIVHAVPAFCLQFLLCRAAKRWAAAVPAVLAVGAALVCGLGLCTATGWDALGWGVLLILCIAPVVGCALGWAVYGVQRLGKRRDMGG